MTHAAWAATGACCVLLAIAAAEGSHEADGSSSSGVWSWAAPADQAPAFVCDSSNLDAMLSDARFVAQGWRWSPGSAAWIAVLVRMDSLKAVGLARIGGLYGP